MLTLLFIGNFCFLVIFKYEIDKHNIMTKKIASSMNKRQNKMIGKIPDFKKNFSKITKN